jgi:hypothetical protein
MMSLWPRNRLPADSPILVVDALGFASKIKSCDRDSLMLLSERLDRQYHRFRAKTPFGMVLVTAKRVFGSGEFSTFRLNDMFVLYSERPRKDAAHRHLVASLLLFQVLLIEGFVPRGGLGAGLVLRKKDSLLGAGFIDAYEASEKRIEGLRNICGIHLSREFLARIHPSTMAYKLLCFYEGSFFLNPRALTDPDMGQFDNKRILQLLRAAGANDEKLNATARFLTNFEEAHRGKVWVNRERRPT